MKPKDIELLSSAIAERATSPDHEALLSGTFAVACYLHATGENEAGRKLFALMTEVMGIDPRTAWVNRLMYALPSNLTDAVCLSGTRHEFQELFRATEIPDR
jgi:hypothetical protein